MLVLNSRHRYEALYPEVNGKRSDDDDDFFFGLKCVKIKQWRIG